MTSFNLTQSLHRTIQQKPRALATRFQGREHTWTQFGERVAGPGGGRPGRGG
jgi:long-chain acyl-CoA synthetase